MKKLPLLLFLLIFGCVGTTPTPKPNTERTTTPIGASVKPRAESTSKAADVVAESGDSIRRKVTELRGVAAQARREAEMAQTEIRRLLLQRTAGEDEIKTLSELFEKVHTRNLFLEMELEKLVAEADEHKSKIKTLEDEIKKLLVEATEADAREASLRRDIANLKRENKEITDQRDSLAEAAQKAEKAAASARTWRTIWIWEHVIVALIVLAYVLIRAAGKSVIGR